MGHRKGRPVTWQTDMRSSGDDGIGYSWLAPGLGWVCDGISELRRACREEVRRGAHHIKLMVSGGVASPTDRIDSTQFSEEEIRAAVEEAEAANLYVMVHAYTARAINRALRCGAKTVEHGNLLDEGSIDLFLENDAFLVPTLSIYQGLADEGVEAGLPEELYNKVFDVLEAGKRALDMAHSGGVKMAYGTDLLGQMHRRQLDEFTIRGEIIPAINVLQAATCNGADLLGRTGELHEVIPGAKADLLVMDGNPLEDLSVMTKPESNLRIIMKAGGHGDMRSSGDDGIGYSCWRRAWVEVCDGISELRRACREEVRRRRSSHQADGFRLASASPMRPNRQHRNGLGGGNPRGEWKKLSVG